MAICGYQMMNNGVHWAGDYPLAFALGYSVGRMAVNRNREIIRHSRNHSQIGNRKKIKPKFQLAPVYYGNDASGIKLTMRF
jgi:hypothetical protein